LAHIIALHEVGSNNPDGIEIKAKKDANGVPLDGIPFHPYYSVHDAYGVAVFLFIFSAVIFFAPEMGGYFLEYNNFIPADPLKTPPHIAPVWYFTPFYSILRATTTEFLTYGLLPCILPRQSASSLCAARCHTAKKRWRMMPSNASDRANHCCGAVSRNQKSNTAR